MALDPGCCGSVEFSTSVGFELTKVKPKIESEITNVNIHGMSKINFPSRKIKAGIG
jgi:hypothetical protein